MTRGFDGFEIDDFRDSGFDSGRDVGRGSSSSWNDPNGLYHNRMENDVESLSRQGLVRVTSISDSEHNPIQLVTLPNR